MFYVGRLAKYFIQYIGVSLDVASNVTNNCIFAVIFLNLALKISPQILLQGNFIVFPHTTFYFHRLNIHTMPSHNFVSNGSIEVGAVDFIDM